MKENGYIVELECGVWLGRFHGDPGRTLMQDDAKIYKRWQDAKTALTRARKYRPFQWAKILKAQRVMRVEVR